MQTNGVQRKLLAVQSSHQGCHSGEKQHSNIAPVLSSIQVSPTLILILKSKGALCSTTLKLFGHLNEGKKQVAPTGKGALHFLERNLGSRRKGQLQNKQLCAALVKSMQAAKWRKHKQTETWLWWMGAESRNVASFKPASWCLQKTQLQSNETSEWRGWAINRSHAVQDVPPSPVEERSRTLSPFQVCTRTDRHHITLAYIGQVGLPHSCSDWKANSADLLLQSQKAVGDALLVSWQAYPNVLDVTVMEKEKSKADGLGTQEGVFYHHIRPSVHLRKFVVYSNQQ